MQNNDKDYEYRKAVKLGLLVGLLGVSMGSLADSAQSAAKGFVDDSHLNVLNRNFYFNRDMRHGGSNSLGRNRFKPVDERKGYREEWAHSVMAFYTSGFTQGTVGFGLDAHAFLGLKLDSGGGRVGLNLLPTDSDGRPEDEYSEAGGALKLRVSDSVLKYGEQMPAAPIFAVSTVRLIPATATGWTLNVKEIEDLELNLGRFTSVNGVDSTNSDDDLTTDYSVGITSKRVDYFGATYKVSDRLNVSFYGSELKDVWRQYYGYAKYVWPVSDLQTLSLTLNAYRTHDTGKQLGDEIDNNAWSLAGTYNFGAHGLTLGYQEINGDEPLDWIGFGSMGGNVFFTNASQFSTFAEANERSWQLRYDLNMAGYGVPGLRFMARYTRGDGMDNSDSNNRFYTARHVYDPNKDNKHWERNLEVSYVLQSGPAKDLSLRVRHATHRATTGIRHFDMDEVRIIAEYPLNIF